MAGFFASGRGHLSGGGLIGLFAAVGGIVVVALLVAWLVRFRPGSQGSIDVPHETAVARGRQDTAAGTLRGGAGRASTGSLLDTPPESPAGSTPAVPLPPSAFLSAVENAIGEEVVFLRLRTPSNVFRLEAPRRGS